MPISRDKPSPCHGGLCAGGDSTMSPSAQLNSLHKRRVWRAGVEWRALRCCDKASVGNQRCHRSPASDDRRCTCEEAKDASFPTANKRRALIKVLGFQRQRRLTARRPVHLMSLCMHRSDRICTRLDSASTVTCNATNESWLVQKWLVRFTILAGFILIL